MISNLSPLLSKALFTSEFIGLKRVLSDQQIPYQALNIKISNTNKENYRGMLQKDKTLTFILTLGLHIHSAVNQQCMVSDHSFCWSK